MYIFDRVVGKVVTSENTDNPLRYAFDFYQTKETKPFSQAKSVADPDSYLIVLQNLLLFMKKNKKALLNSPLTIQKFVDIKEDLFICFTTKEEFTLFALFVALMLLLPL